VIAAALLGAAGSALAQSLAPAAFKVPEQLALQAGAPK